ncbi:protein EXPRESSION OF TERPENOIDS 1-like [Benincasa hispida]|uniref:protein EXPRESSION OF TERPENOIDS 1-like n=1 Tax=Benincasa hispida TaxID=102211 RepID=UPI001900DB6A|nr:protein EXPRESSION OF TERPENOIDS 1-like [Benincasa hispida]
MRKLLYLGGKQEVDEEEMIRGREQQLFLYSTNNNEEIYSKGLEIWPQQNVENYISFGVMGPTRKNFVINASDHEFVSRLGFPVMRGGGGGMNCQDCGNQAKKDCSHLRCRTCCKSRGFHCQTHVKSTWVPAAKRRERQQQRHQIVQHHHRQQFQADQSDQTTPKRHGENQPPLVTPIVTSGLEVAHFPTEFNSVAVFRCVKVSAIDNVEEQLAYQTSINVGGHMFKGILYDHGLETSQNTSTGGESSYCHDGEDDGQALDLLIGASNDGGRVSQSSSAPLSMESSLYPISINTFNTGTQFFPSTRA